MPVSSSEPAVIREGWLLKPPGQLRKFLPRASWNRRYFVLSADVVDGHSKLDYYQDEAKKKKKRSIDLEQCLQVDSYLTYEVHKNKVHQWIFDLKLQNSRKQCFLMAENEREMNDWVHDLCRVCNLEREEHSDGTLTPKTPDMLLQIMQEQEEEETNGDRLHSFSFDNGPSSLSNDTRVPPTTPSQPPTTTTPTQGYIKLWETVTPNPRPREHHRNGSTPASVHHRGHSSDSTASSVHLSDEMNTTLEDGIVSPPRPPPTLRIANQLSLDAVIPPPPKPRSHAPPLPSYSNDTHKTKQIPSTYDAPPPAPQNIFGSLPHCRPNGGRKSSRETILQSSDASGFTTLPRMGPKTPDNKPPSAGAPGKLPGYTPMNNKIAFYEPMSQFAGMDDDLPIDEPPSSAGENYQNVTPLTRTPANSVSTPAPPTVDRTLKPDRKRKESSEASSTSPGVPDSPVRGFAAFKQESNNKSRESTDSEGYLKQDRRPPPVPEKPNIRIEKKESFVRRQQNGHQPVQVPSRLPKTSVKTRSNTVGSKSPVTPTRPMVAKPREDPIASSLPTSTSLNLTRRLEYIDVNTTALASPRTPSPSSLLHHHHVASASADHDSDEPDSPRKPTYAHIDQAATKAVKNVLPQHENDRFKSLERKRMQKPPH